MINVRLQGNAIDLANWKAPSRNTTDRHGQPAIEKLPTQQSIYMLNPAGHGVWVALHTGSGNRNEHDPFRIRKLDEKQRKGFMRFDRCPQANEHATTFMPADLQGQPVCREGAKGGPIHYRNPCKCLVAIEKFRTEQHAEKMAKEEARFVTNEQRERDRRDRELQQRDKLLELALTNIAAQSSEGKKKS